MNRFFSVILVIIGAWAGGFSYEAIAGLGLHGALAQLSGAFTAGDVVVGGPGSTQVQDSNNVATVTLPAELKISPASGIALSVLETSDTSWTAFGNPAGVVATHGAQNNFVGFALNDLAASTNALPVAVAGYGKTAAGSNGNQVFGLYGLGELYATGGGVAIGEEITCRNKSGNVPTTALPLDESIGTSQTVCNALQVTAGGTNNSSIGIQVSNEAGSSSIFNTGIYLEPKSFAQYGLYIDSQSTGGTPTVTDAVLNNNGQGTPLQIGITGTAVPSNPVIIALDHASATIFEVTQSGSVTANSYTANGSAGLSCSGTPSSSFASVNGIVTHC